MSGTGNGASGIGVSGFGGAVGTRGETNSGTGVYGGTISGKGVFGLATTSGQGVYGSSGTDNGVRGLTGSSTAAAISALAPSNTGLAYYGTGNIIISGSTAQKAGGGSWSAPSDARIKKNVNTLQWGLEELREVRPVTFQYNGLGGTDNDERMYVGVIAQELEKVFPTMVTSRKGKLHEGDTKDTNIKVVDPSAFTYVLINAVKEQQDLIERQERRIAMLERARGSSLSATLLGGGIGTILAMGLLSLAFVAIRKRKESKAAP